MPLDSEIANGLLEIIGGEKAKMETDDPEAAKHLADALQSIRDATTKQPDPPSSVKLSRYGGDNIQKNLPSGPPAAPGTVYKLYPRKKVRS